MPHRPWTLTFGKHEEHPLVILMLVAGQLAAAEVEVWPFTSGRAVVRAGILRGDITPFVRLVFTLAGKKRSARSIRKLRKSDQNPNLSDLREAMIATGAFALTEGSKDSAILVTLNPGVYTVHTTSADQTTGMALVEIYEAP